MQQHRLLRLSGWIECDAFHFVLLLLSQLNSREFSVLNDLLDKPWKQVSFLLPPEKGLPFRGALVSKIPLLDDVRPILLTRDFGYCGR